VGAGSCDLERGLQCARWRACQGRGCHRADRVGTGSPERAGTGEGRLLRHTADTTNSDRASNGVTW